MNPHSTYETLRQFADSWGLLILVVAFVVLTAWPFRPGSRDYHRDAANMIFRDKNDGE
ncbi:MAG: cbb3-type cytochrome c oxidase subunit 3 [Sphingomonadaceae bacterium]|nr:cbb3-type cytochrome c oxidase subunit 3 [Sphingomonadaceae bacterium]